MPYVDRTGGGVVVGIYACEQRAGQEFVDGDVALWVPFNQPAALQRARDVRTPILNALIGIGLAADRAGDLATVDAVLAARQGLLDITKLPALLAAASDDEFDSVALARYRELAAAAPVAVRAAFLVAAS
jgi:hypothetical protein